MGCSDSKSASTQNGTKKPAEADPGKDQEKDTKEDEVYVTVHEAVAYIKSEYAVDDDHAKRIIDKINKNNDDKISESELRKLWATVKERREEVEKLFHEIDTDKNGYVTDEQAADVITKRFKKLPEAGVKAMVKRFDKDGDGRVDYNEFIFFYCNIVARKEYLTGQFRQLDKDGSGKLDPDELWRFIRDECHVTEKYARSLVEDFDCNKDGSISKMEFVNMLDCFAEKLD